MYNTFKLSGKGTLAGQNSGKFLINTEGAIFHYPKMEKISQVKRQSGKII